MYPSDYGRKQGHEVEVLTEIELDEIDTNIIKLLQNNSRISVADIAREIDELTENAIRYRIDRLESEGYISDYTIRLNPKKFGKNIIVIFRLNVLPQDINDSIEHIQSVDNITEIYLTAGDFSIVAIGFFDDNKAVTQFVTEELKEIKILDYDVITVLRRVKHELYSI
jgi:DNA-binding Lrp family transcriptional regulator